MNGNATTTPRASKTVSRDGAYLGDGERPHGIAAGEPVGLRAREDLEMHGERGNKTRLDST